MGDDRGRQADVGCQQGGVCLDARPRQQDQRTVTALNLPLCNLTPTFATRSVLAPAADLPGKGAGAVVGGAAGGRGADQRARDRRQPTNDGSGRRGAVKDPGDDVQRAAETTGEAAEPRTGRFSKITSDLNIVLTSVCFQKVHDMLKQAWDAEGSPFKGQPFDPSKLNVTNQGSTFDVQP